MGKAGLPLRLPRWQGPRPRQPPGLPSGWLHELGVFGISAPTRLGAANLAMPMVSLSDLFEAFCLLFVLPASLHNLIGFYLALSPSGPVVS
jgi:hypothetical protein